MYGCNLVVHADLLYRRGGCIIYVCNSEREGDPLLVIHRQDDDLNILTLKRLAFN